MPRPGVGRDPAAESHIASAVVGGIGVHQLPVETLVRHADPVTDPRNRGKIEDEDEGILGGSSPPKEGDNTGVLVPEIDPFKPGKVIVQLIEGRLRHIQPVEVPHQPLQSRMQVVLEKPPGQLFIVVPFGPLTDFPPHEEGLFSGFPIHVPQQEP